jgi:uncharacterized protein (DUF362 family)
MSIVSMQKTASDDYAGIFDAVKRAIEGCGGLQDIIKPGDKVLVKPNLVATPESRLSGAVTRYEVTLAVAELVKQAGGVPFVAESAAAGVNTKDVISLCEYYKIEEAGIPVLDLKGEPKAKLPVPGGQVVQELDTWQCVADADVVISVPILKTHDNEEVTLGMKNLKGLISDPQKKAFHFKGVTGGVVDIIEAVKPALCVMDATYAMEGSGPIFGTPVKMDLILASKDIVACDAVGSTIMGFEVDEPPITVEAYQRGLGEMNLDKITVRGEQIGAVKRRFTRSHEVTVEGLPPYTLIVSDAACTGCRNAVVSSLKRLVSDGYQELIDGKYVVAGPVTELPEGATPENTVLVGRCAAQPLAGRGAVAMGCPPDNKSFVNAVKSLHGLD